MNKKRKYAYAAMTSAILTIIAIIIVNVIVNVISDKIALKIDLTKDNILEFSDETEEILSNLDTKVNIISLIPESDSSREMIQIDEVIKKYERSSNKITYKRVDSKKNPNILSKYKKDGKNLDSEYYVIFETARMYSVVCVNDLFTMYKDNKTENILSGALSAEQYFSSALIKVTKGSEVYISVSKGHGEVFNSENFKNDILPGAGFNFKDVDLVSEDIDSKSKLLIISSPQSDFSPSEIEKIDSFTKMGGDIQVICDANNNEFPNLFGYMKEWGAGFEQGMAAESEATNYAGYKTYIIGSVFENDITKTIGLGSQNVIFPLSRPVSSEKKTGISISTLVSTSDKGYVKQNIFTSVDSYEEGDIRKKSDLAVIFTKRNNDDSLSNLFVMGTSFFLGEYSNEKNESQFSNILSETGNRKFYTGLISFMTDQPSNFYVMPKNIVQDRVTVDQMSIFVYTVITVIAIPVIVLAIGFVIWLRRRQS